MAEPNQGCFSQLMTWIGMMFFGFFTVFGMTSNSGVQPIPDPIFPTPTPIGMGVPATAIPAELGLLELVDMSSISVAEASALVGTQIGTTGLPDVSRFSFETIIDNRHIASAVAMLDQMGMNWQIEITFTPEGSEIIAAYTESHTGSVLGIVLNGELLSAPTIQSRIADQAVVQGNFTEAEARLLAAQLSATQPE